MIKVGEISEKYDILTAEEKRITLIGNKTKRIFEMNPRQMKLEERRLKALYIWIRK